MAKPKIAVGTLGGTITMVSNDSGSGIAPSLDAVSLLAGIPALREIAEVTAETLLRAPGASLTFDQLAAALSWARNMVAQGSDGVVLVQGTDTLEESAYYFDLFWDQAEPLVLTGAMRSPEQVASDGPANLVAAVAVAGHPGSRGRGVLVVMNDEVHAATRVKKIRASGLAAFRSSSFGPLGCFEEGNVVYVNRADRPEPLTLLRTPISTRIALIETHLGDEGLLLRTAADSGFDGIVLAGFGVGHVSASLADAVSEVARALPVVLTSRTGTGTTFQSTYGFKGSEMDLLQRGAIPGGWLDSRKACVLLTCLTAAGVGADQIRTVFAARGQLQREVDILVK